MKKRILATLLSLVLLFSLLPTAVMAVSCSDSDCSHVAAIGTEHFETLRAAIEAAQDGQTVSVLKSHTIELDSSYTDIYDVDGYTAVFVVKDKNVTVDFNGCTVLCDMKMSFSSNGMIGFATVGNGTLVLKDGSSTHSGGIKLLGNHYNVSSLLRNHNNTASLTVESGNYSCDEANVVDKGDALIYSVGSDRVTINGGCFTLENVGLIGANGNPWIFNAKGQNSSHVNVNGGTFNADVSRQKYIFESQSPANRALVNNGDGTWTFTDANCYVAEQEWSSAWYTYERGFVSLSDAVADVTGIRTRDGKTSAAEFVKLFTDCDVDDTLIIHEDMEIRLDGHTVNWTGTDGKPILTVTAGKTLTIDPAFLPNKEGHTCLGLYTDAALTIPTDLTSGTVGSASTTEDISLYAKWSVNSYTVTYKDGVNGTVFADVVLTEEYGKATPSFGTDPVRSGYTFVGWTPAVSAMVGADDAVYTAVWEAIPASSTPTLNGRPNPRTGI